MSNNKQPTDLSALSDKMRKEYEDAFSVFDENGNGSISVKELERVLTSLGYNKPEELQKMMQEVHKDGNGSIEFEEFCVLMMKNQNDPEHEIREAFKALDTNQDGFISRAELKAGMQKMGMHLTENDIEEMIREADVDGDGQINFQEFRNMNMNDR